MLLLAPGSAVLGALLHAHPTARLAGPLLRRRAALMVEQSVSSSVARLDADSLLDAKAPQIALYKDFFFPRLRFLFLFCFYFSPLIGDFFSYFFPITSKHESLWLVYNPF